MTDIKMKLEVQGADKVETLIELLSKHIDSLPVELVNSLKDLADCDACEIGLDQLKNLGVNPHDVSCFIDNENIDRVVSANKILKRVSMFDDGVNEIINCYPDNFKMINKEDRQIVGW